MEWKGKQSNRPVPREEADARHMASGPERYDGQRPSGIYPSPVRREPSAFPELPQQPLCISYLLRPGLRAPVLEGVTAVSDGDVHGLVVNVHVLDASAEPVRLRLRLRAAKDRPAGMIDADGLSPRILIAGAFDDPELAELAARSCASAWARDLAHGYGVLPTLAAGYAREHAARDPRYKAAWVDGELGGWLRVVYAKYGFTPAQLRVLGLLGLGMTERDIADLGRVSLKSVEHHTQALRDKSGKGTDALLARFTRSLRAGKVDSIGLAETLASLRTPRQGNRI